MKVVQDGSLSEEHVARNSNENSTCYEKKMTNENQLDEKIDKSNMMNKADVCKNCLTDDGSCSEDESNISTATQKTCKLNCQQNGEKQGDDDSGHIDELTTQVMKLNVSDREKNDSIDKVTEQISGMTVKDKETQDGRKSPQLLPRGPNGGRAVPFSQIAYGQPDWSSTQAGVRMKYVSGKRGYEEEINPFKYTKNNEPVEHGDYTDMAFLPQVVPQQTISQVMTHQARSQPLVSHAMTQQAIPRPMAPAYNGNLNNLNQPQMTTYPGIISNQNVLSGGSVTSTDPILQQPSLFNTDAPAQYWDPDGLLALLDEESFTQNFNNADNFIETSQLPQKEYQSDEQIMKHQINGLQKTKRNLSGDDGYDSDFCRMSTSTSPYSPESVMSTESMPSPQSVGQNKSSQYMPQTPFSPSSNMGSPHSVDSGYRDQGSPASLMSVMSPAMSPPSTIPAESPMSSPAHNLSLSCTDGQTQDIIISELNKPIPQSPVDQGIPAEQYINDNLSRLKDVYDVIAIDLKSQQNKKTENQVKNNSNPVKPMTNAVPVSATPKGPVLDQTKPGKAASIAVTAPIQTLPVATSTMTPVILKPINTTAAQQPQLIQVGQGTKMPLVGQPIAGQPISGQNIVWVPLNPAPPIIVVRQTTPAGPKKAGPTKPRPILPKMPTVLPGASKTSTSVTSSNGKTGASSSPSAKTHVINSAPTVVNALATAPGGRPANKMATSPKLITGNNINNNNNRMMMAGQYQPQQPLQTMPRLVQGQMVVPGMGVPQSLNPAMDGCAPNQLNLARRYIAEAKKEDLHFQDQDGDTYLHVAVCRTDRFLVKAILERLVREGLIKELIDKPNKKRQTPLYVAVADNQPVMVRELVQCGADPNCLAECQWNNGMRKEVKAAIHCAAQGGHLFTSTLAELLKAKDIALNLANSEGLTAVHCAIQEHGKLRGSQVINSIPAVSMLIRAGADPNVQDKKSGKTPLMYAIETKDYNLVVSMVNLIDKDKLRNMLKTQTFDGSNCSKICSGLRMDSDVDGWRKINSLILSVSNGSDPRLCDVMTMMAS